MSPATSRSDSGLGLVLNLGALCRLDGELVATIEACRRLPQIALRAALLMTAGSALYGFVFGLWRAGEQAVYSAIKLPLLLIAVVVASALINGFLALLLRSGVGVFQGLVAILLSLSIAAVLLASLAPVALLITLSVPGPGDTAVDAAALHRIAQNVLLFHIVAVGASGLVGNVQLYRLLCRLTPSRSIAARVLVSWIVVDGFVGTQLSWILRPYLCKPGLEPQFIRVDALHGNFFEEVWRIVGPFFLQ